MIKVYKISKDLVVYIERLHYESFRYTDLMDTISRDSHYYTDEEWESSYNYFNTLKEEANLKYELAKKEIKKIYKELIGESSWYIDFRSNLLVVDDPLKTISNKLNSKKREPYSNKLTRIYPENYEVLKINSNHVKDITFQVTDACNLNCSYCYQHNKGAHSMSFETAKAFIDMILDSDEKTNSYITSNKCKGAIINFIGGEPWLEIDLITKISNYFIGELFRRKHPWIIRFSFSICSNGLLHFDERVQTYMKKHTNHLSYNISIDGNKELHDSCRIDFANNGSYDRAIAGVKDYKETFKKEMGSKMTIAPGNVDKVFSAVSYMIKENGYKHINLNCVYEKGWTNEHANTLYWELHKLTDWLFENNLQNEVYLSIFNRKNGVPMPENSNRNWCGGTGLMLAVDYKGDIYPCLRYMESSIGDKAPPYIIGNIKDGINIKKEHQERINCLECITRKSQSTEECFNCPIAAGCSWCSAHNYECFGTPNKRATFICCMHKARVLANVYYQRRKGKNFPMHCPKEWAVEIIGETEFNKLNSMKAGDK